LDARELVVRNNIANFKLGKRWGSREYGAAGLFSVIPVLAPVTPGRFGALLPSGYSNFDGNNLPTNDREQSSPEPG